MSERPAIPRLMAKADMGRRWGKKRNVIHNWETREGENFPKAVIIVGNGTMPLYRESDVLAYEKAKKIVVVDDWVCEMVEDSTSESSSKK